jgi:predicted DNA-binding protein (MmcQ/YjbR family)
MRPTDPSPDAQATPARLRLRGGPQVGVSRQAPAGASMSVPQLKKFCRGFPGASETLYEEPYNFLVYAVGGKKFAYFKTSDPERWRFSTRVSPDRFIELTDVPGVKPARYRGRFYWVTVVNVSAFPASYLVELVECSYRRALASLSKARQTAIRHGRLTATPGGRTAAPVPCRHGTHPSQPK